MIFLFEFTNEATNRTCGGERKRESVSMIEKKNERAGSRERLTIDSSTVVRSDDDLLHRFLFVVENTAEEFVSDDVFGESFVRENGCEKGEKREESARDDNDEGKGRERERRETDRRRVDLASSA